MKDWIALLVFMASMFDRLHCHSIEAEFEGSGQSDAVIELLSLAPIRTDLPSAMHVSSLQQIPIRIPPYQLTDQQPTDEMDEAVIRLCRVLGQCQPEVLENEMAETSIVSADNGEPAKKDVEHFIYPSGFKGHFATLARTTTLPSAPSKEDKSTKAKVYDTELSEERESTTEEIDSTTDDDISTTTEYATNLKTTRTNLAIYSRYRMNSNPIVRMPPSITTKTPKLSELERGNRRVDRLPKIPVPRRNFTAMNAGADNSTDSRILYSPSYVQISGAAVNDGEGRPEASTEPTSTLTKATTLAKHPNFQEFLKHVQYSQHASPVLTSGYASVKMNH